MILMILILVIVAYPIWRYKREKQKTKTKKMTYSYKCKGKCRMVQDYVHGMNEEPVFECCGKRMGKLITAPQAIIGANTGGRKGG